MARDVMADDSPYAGRFVVSMITEGPEVGGDAVTQPVGTICEVRSAEQFPDGRWLLLVVGVARARLGVVDRSGPYAVVEVEPIDEPVTARCRRSSRRYSARSTRTSPR
jgi:Lon protease-like protein